MSTKRGISKAQFGPLRITGAHAMSRHVPWINSQDQVGPLRVKCPGSIGKLQLDHFKIRSSGPRQAERGFGRRRWELDTRDAVEHTERLHDLQPLDDARPRLERAAPKTPLHTRGVLDLEVAERGRTVSVLAA